MREQGNLRLLAFLGLLIGLGGPLGYFVGRPAWNAWRLAQALQQAKDFEAAQDYPQLMLALQRAAQMGSSDIETWQRIADTLSRLGSEQAVVARSNVLSLSPGDWEARIAYATEALRFGQTTQARDALDTNIAGADHDAAYQRVSARLALLLGDYASLSEHLQALLELDPQNNEARLLLALVQLWSLDATTRATGQAALEGMLDQPTLQVRAALELLKFAAREQDGAMAARLVARLRRTLPSPAVSFPPGDDVSALIAQLQVVAAGSASDASILAKWMGEIRRKPAALAWLQSLPSEIRDQPAPLETAAELALSDDRLDDALDYLRRGALGPLSTPTVVLVLSTRQLQLRGRNDIADETWKSVIRLAESAPSESVLRTAARIANGWQQAAWARDALEAGLTRNPDARWAYAALREQGLAQADANRLWALYDRWVERQPKDPAIVSQWLRLGLALPVAEKRLNERASELIAGLPESPAKNALRAGWLWHQGLREEAKASLALAADAPILSGDAAYWAALVDPVAEPLTEFPVLTRIPLLPAERDLLTQAFRDKTKLSFPAPANAGPELENL